jgi:small conductance mechanosensitive channel
MDPKFIDKAYDWLLRVGPKILLGIIIFIIAQVLIRLIKKWSRQFMVRREFDSSLQPFLISLIFAILQVLTVLATMQVVGIQMTIFAALIGGIGVAAGLALSGTLQNFTSGILILLLKPFKVGDIIVAQGQEGVVESIQIFYTVVVTYDNRDVIIPNGKLSNDLIVNISKEGTRRMDLDIKLPFTVDYKQVVEVVQKAIADDKNLLKDPPPRVGVNMLEGDGYHLSIDVWTQPHNFVDMKLAFLAHLLESLRAAGIKLPGM